LYAGLIETEKGLFLLEYNVRLGDPETQILMARLSSDLLPFFLWMCGDEPIPKKPEWRPKSAVGIVLASCNYPQGVGLLSTPIEGVGGVETDDIFVFHGAASYDKKGRLYGTGGRVLTVVGLGATHEESRQYAYGALRKMSWPHGHYREDIGILKIRDSSDAEDIY
jgi:phosphoribosylamine--glycine ligase